MSERRNSARQKSFLRGRIYFNHKRSSIDCLVRDISHNGARLIFSETGTIPDVVELYIPQKEQTLRAWVQWRSSGEMGVAFRSAAQAPARPAADAELHARVQELEAEVATLKRLIKKLKAEMACADPDAA